MNLDKSQLHDRLGYWLYREMGVPAPRAIHANLYINGAYNGLFSMVEQIDEQFASFNFSDGSGNLSFAAQSVSSLAADDISAGVLNNGSFALI